jgi:hypothetical protein
MVILGLAGTARNHPAWFFCQSFIFFGGGLLAGRSTDGG